MLALAGEWLSASSLSFPAATANGHVAKIGLQTGAKLIFGTDTHAPGDLVTVQYARTVLLGAGIEEGLIEGVFENASALLHKITG